MIFKKVSDSEILAVGSIGMQYHPTEDIYADLDFQNLKQLLASEFPNKNVTLSLYSGGGSVYTANALADTISEHGRVTVVGYGLVGSAATFLLVAGKAAYLRPEAQLLIHNASSVVWGNKNDLMREAQALENLDKTIRAKYAKQIGLVGKLKGANGADTETELINMMNMDSFVTAKDAFDMGLIDGYYEGNKLIKQPKEKPAIQPDPAGEPAPTNSVVIRDNFSDLSSADRTQVAAYYNSMVADFAPKEQAIVKDYFNNYWGKKETPAKPTFNPMETPQVNPVAQPTNTVVETATPEQRKGFFTNLLEFMGFNTPPATTPTSQVQTEPIAPPATPVATVPPAVEVAPVAPAAPQNEAPAVPVAPVAPVVQNVTPATPAIMPIAPLSTMERANEAARNTQQPAKASKKGGYEERRNHILDMMNECDTNPESDPVADAYLAKMQKSFAQNITR